MSFVTSGSKFTREQWSTVLSSLKNIFRNTLPTELQIEGEKARASYRNYYTRLVALQQQQAQAAAQPRSTAPVAENATTAGDQPVCICMTLSHVYCRIHANSIRHTAG